jgi:hypothetical protein
MENTDDIDSMLPEPPVDDASVPAEDPGTMGSEFDAGQGAEDVGGDELPEPPSDEEGEAPAAPAAAAPKGGKDPINVPVGDIQVKKKSGTYNTYNVTLSMGQIVAIRQALEKDHASPLADELLKLFSYYSDTVPGPGEEEEDVKAREEQAAIGAGQTADADEDSAIPMPPGEKGQEGTTVAGEGPEEPADDENFEPAQSPGVSSKSARRQRPRNMPGAEDFQPPRGGGQQLPEPPRE